MIMSEIASNAQTRVGENDAQSDIVGEGQEQEQQEGKKLWANRCLIHKIADF